MSWVYTLFNLAVLVPCVVISVVRKQGPLQNKKALLAGYASVSALFIIWDILAARAGHWFFSDTYTLAYRFLGLPIEEIAFFITVPFGCMLVWDALPKEKFTMTRVQYRLLLGAIGLSGSILAVFGWENGYSRTAGLAVLLVLGVLVWAQPRLVTAKRFWYFQLSTLGLFLICNLFLTALPVITYNDAAKTSWHILTIPIEDLFYNFALLNSFLLVYINPRFSPGHTER